MKVWFCRDNDGTCTAWDGTKDKPIIQYDYKNGRWDSTIGKDCDLIADEGCEDSDNDIFEMFGKGFHDVRKGRCKLLDLEVKKKQVVSDPLYGVIDFTQVFYDCGKGVEPVKIIPEAPESEMLEKVVDIIADNKDEEILRLRKALEEIRDFGFINAGCGYSCAKKARKALEE